MTSSQNPFGNFILTPQQQSLLFAALESNRANGATPSMSPTSINPSPAQNITPNGLPGESPSLDYDYAFDGPDTSFDFSFDDTAATGKMIGEYAGSISPVSPDEGAPRRHYSNDSSTSPENDSPDKRSHPDDEEDDESNDPKRHESGDKGPKKPGRKPLTSEPTSKRKAQNRAAQRAFRERKEKHLKDLETKVTDLEKASAASNQENGLLRAQVEKMTVQLEEYKKTLSLVASMNPQVAKSSSSSSSSSIPSSNNLKFGNPILNNINDVNFQFEFPKFGQLPGPSAGGQRAAPSRGSVGKSSTSNSSPASQASPMDAGRVRPSPTSSAYTPASLDAQTKEDLASFSGVFSPPLTNKNMKQAHRASGDSQYINGATSTSSPTSSSHSNMGPSSSCGTSPEPFTQSPAAFKPVEMLTTIGEENQDAGHFANIDVNDPAWLTSQDNFQFDPQLFGGYREPQDNVLSSGGYGESFFNDAFDIDFNTPYNTAPAPAAQKKDLLAEIDAAKETDHVDAAGNPLTCTKIWEKLQGCPRVQSGDFDLDGLCADLQKKAKCSGNGPVIDEGDFTNVIKKYLGDSDCKGESRLKTV